MASAVQATKSNRDLKPDRHTLPHSSVLETLVPAGGLVILSPARDLLHHPKVLIRYDDAKLCSWMFVLHYPVPKPAGDPAVECNLVHTSNF